MGRNGCQVCGVEFTWQAAWTCPFWDLGEGDNVTKLYCQILELPFRDISDRTLYVFNQVVAAIILPTIPFHVADLGRFVLQAKPLINFILDKLSSVISVGHDGGICVMHLSFYEFMCDPCRCPPRFYIDRTLIWPTEKLMISWTESRQRSSILCWILADFWRPTSEKRQLTNPAMPL